MWLREQLDESPAGQRSTCLHVGRMSPCSWNRMARPAVSPETPFLRSLVDQALLQLDIPSLDILIPSFTKGRPILVPQLLCRLKTKLTQTLCPCLELRGPEWALAGTENILSSLGGGGMDNLTAPRSPVLLRPGLRGQGSGSVPFLPWGCPEG